MGAQQAAALKWRQASVPARMKLVNVGGYNVYALDAMGQIWKLDIDTILEFGWQLLPGNASFVEGTEGRQLWCVNSTGEVFYYYRGWTGTRWEKASGCMKQISVGKGQFIWAVDMNGGIWSTNETSQNWTRMPGNASCVSVGRDGSVWCVTPTDEIFKWNPQIQNWDKIPGSLCQISVYDTHTVIGVNRNQEIWYWDRHTSGWKQFPGTLSQVSVGATGYQHVWGVTAQGEVWFHRSSDKDTFLVHKKMQEQNAQINAQINAHAPLHINAHNPLHTPVEHIDIHVDTGHGHSHHRASQQGQHGTVTGNYTYNG